LIFPTEFQIFTSPRISAVNKATAALAAVAAAVERSLDVKTETIALCFNLDDNILNKHPLNEKQLHDIIFTDMCSNMLNPKQQKMTLFCLGFNTLERKLVI
jgi:hypothetical protein